MSALLPPWLPGCPFRRLTGWLCPGCGVTHAALALLHGDLALAWRSNPLVLCLLPLLLVYVVVGMRRHRAQRPWPAVPPAATCMLLLAAGLFAIARNL